MLVCDGYLLSYCSSSYTRHFPLFHQVLVSHSPQSDLPSPCQSQPSVRPAKSSSVTALSQTHQVLVSHSPQSDPPSPRQSQPSVRPAKSMSVTALSQTQACKCQFCAGKECTPDAKRGVLFNSVWTLRFLEYVVVVVVAFFLRSRILGQCSTIHSPPAFFFLKWRLAHSH